MRPALLAALFCAGCTAIIGDPDPRDVVPDNPALDMSGSGCADVQTDPRNCGSCGHDCTRLPGVDPTRVGCTIGVCDLRGACLSGRADCTGGYLDGCETDLTTAGHCGTCTAQCGGVEPLCARDVFGNYTCTGTCPTAEPTQCGSSCVDILNDPQHCGGCTACSVSKNAVAVCQNGVCGSACNTGFHTCNGFCLSDTSIQSCGTLCTPCPSAPAHGVEYCDAFAGCAFKCNNGFVLQLGQCVAVAPATDMATGGLPLCDCTGLDPDPLGTGTRNQCPITNECVSNNCCAENQINPTPGTCTDPTPCTISATPQ